MRDEQEALAEIVRNLGAERDQLIKWVESDIAGFGGVSEAAARARAHAQQLVNSRSEQGLNRQAREQRLVDESRGVRAALDRLPSERPSGQQNYVSFSEIPEFMNYALGLRGSYGWGWESWVKHSGRWDEIDRLSKKLLATVPELYARRQASRDAAREAVDRMDSTVRRALWLSTNTFHDGESAPRSDSPKAAAAPLAAFLLVALVGIFCKPVAVTGWLAVTFLVAVVVVSARWMLVQGRRTTSVAAFAAGSSLALFTAAYLATRLIDPGSVSRSENPISSVAEAAFTSLTVGLTGGTIGIELGGAARIVAFVQILLTVAAVASGVAWGWRRLLEHADRVEAPSVEGG